MKLILIILALTFATPAFAEFSTQEETQLKQIAQRVTQLTALADNLKSETLPLEIAKLRVERTQIIESRDSEISAIKAQGITDVNKKMSDYEILIDAKESEISAKETTLNNLP